jgi:lon-related putative ATP-dependent protease
VKDRLVVPIEQLRRTWDPGAMGFKTTEELPVLEGLVGQDRAVASLQFGLAMRSPGYGIYVAGPSGTGKTSYTIALTRSFAAKQPAPQDWVYVHNFDHPDEPLTLAFPPGTATTFSREMEELIRDGRALAGQAQTSEDYRKSREELVRQVRNQMAVIAEEIESMARETGFALSRTEQGPVPVPVMKGQPITEEQFTALPPEAKREIGDRAQVIQVAIVEAGRKTMELEKLLQGQLRDLDMRVAQGALAPGIKRLKDKYKHLPQVVDWLNRAELEMAGSTIPDHVEGKTGADEAAAAAELASMGMRKRRVDPYARFRVNVFVIRHKKVGAPVVVETNPTYQNLFGKAEYFNVGDGPLEDVAMQIKPGAIHRANGGYLVLQAADVLRSPYSWEALKRALSTHEARIEALGQENRALPLEIVRPQPMPLDVKVILIGGSGIYHMLYAQDEGFHKLFKLKSEFDVTLEATEANVLGLAGFIAQVCRRDNLKHFTAEAVSAVIEHSHRLAEDQTKLSARFNETVDVVYEANAWAEQAQSRYVEADHVWRAVREKQARSSLSEMHLQEMIERGTILFDIDGAVAGQVNGLTVMNVGDHSFGSPSRITARVYLGQKGILHIEREIAMSGQIHDKGLFTLTAYLGDRFAQDKPLAFSASVAFEQTYVPVDGDSASSTELYALLSALADLPIDQGIAVTGSVNQRGQVQPIGGVNEKIEGFFRVCQSLGLSGRQGVMMPRRNLPNLALSQEVLEAVKAGQFHIWAVSTIEEGIEVLTGVPAGQRGPDGRYTAGSVFDRVDRRITGFAQKGLQWNHGENYT